MCPTSCWTAGVTRVVDGRHYKRTAQGNWREVTKDFGDWFQRTSKRPEGIVSEMWKAIRMKDRVRAGRALKRMNEIVGKNLGMIEEAEEERARQQITHGRGPRMLKANRARRTRELTHEQAQERCERTEMYNAQMTSENAKGLKSTKIDYKALKTEEEGFEGESEAEDENEQIEQVGGTNPSDQEREGDVRTEEDDKKDSVKENDEERPRDEGNNGTETSKVKVEEREEVDAKECDDKEEEERAKMTEKFIKAEMRAEKKKKKRGQGDKLAVKKDAEVKRL